MLKKLKRRPNLEESKLHRQDLKVRLLSTSVMLIVLAGYLSLAIISTEATRWNLHVNVKVTNNLFFVLSAILTALMGYEVIHALGVKKRWALGTLVFLTAFLFVYPFFTLDNKFPIYEMWNADQWFEWWQSLIFLLVFGGVFCFVTWQIKELHSWLVGLKLAGICLLIIFGMKGFTILSLDMNVGEPHYGFVSIFWIWGTIIATDSLAYWGGTNFGRHSLAPKISPKKSWEGAVIGSAGAFVIGSLVSLLTFYLVPGHDYGPFEVPFKNIAGNLGVAVPGILMVLLTFVFSVLAQFGDLLFSLIKRSVGVKDFSKLIPGHGGILDRLDSFVFTFLFVFIIVQFA